MDKFFESKSARYIYIGLLALVMAISYKMQNIYGYRVIEMSENFLFFLLVLCPVIISAILALLLAGGVYKRWFISTNIFILLSSLIIIGAPVNDISAGGMFGFEKETVGIILIGIYSIVSVFFYAQYLLSFQKKRQK